MFTDGKIAFTVAYLYRSNVSLYAWQQLSSGLFLCVITDIDNTSISQYDVLSGTVLDKACRYGFGFVDIAYSFLAS
jgi:hypothetical protein